jgi:pimeloyl-ACP methyl ester carboxylesterase
MSTVGRAWANGIELCFETFGDRLGEPLLMIMGNGAQLISWPSDFCEQFVARGFYVIRFDNRDVGLSTRFDDCDVDLAAVRAGSAPAPYGLSDMAADAVGLLDFLGVEQTHLLGASMGGMIAQTIAISYPDRVRSLSSLMSSTGDRSVGGGDPAAIAALTAVVPTDRTTAVEQAIERGRLLAGPAFPFDPGLARDRAERAWDRANYPAGRRRHTAAALTQPDRTEALGKLRVPTVVIHGSVDPVVSISGGLATSRAIPGARLVVIEGMGHEVPAGAQPRIVDAVTSNARRALQSGSPRLRASEQ